MNGFVPLLNKTFDSLWAQPKNIRTDLIALTTYIRRNATYPGKTTNRSISFDGKPYFLQNGECFFTYEYLAKEMNLTPSTLRNRLKRLMSLCDIQIHTSRHKHSGGVIVKLGSEFFLDPKTPCDHSEDTGSHLGTVPQGRKPCSKKQQTNFLRPSNTTEKIKNINNLNLSQSDVSLPQAQAASEEGTKEVLDYFANRFPDLTINPGRFQWQPQKSVKAYHRLIDHLAENALTAALVKGVGVLNYPNPVLARAQKIEQNVSQALAACRTEQELQAALASITEQIRTFNRFRTGLWDQSATEHYFASQVATVRQTFDQQDDSIPAGPNSEPRNTQESPSCTDGSEAPESPSQDNAQLNDHPSELNTAACYDQPTTSPVPKSENCQSSDPQIDAIGADEATATLKPSGTQPAPPRHCGAQSLRDVAERTMIEEIRNRLTQAMLRMGRDKELNAIVGCYDLQTLQEYEHAYFARHPQTHQSALVAAAAQAGGQPRSSPDRSVA